MKTVAAIFFLVFPVFAEVPLWFESLESALEKALKISPELKTARAELEAFEFAHQASFSIFLPTLSLEGNYFYQTNVPMISIGSGQSFSAGTHDNYALGPVLRYTLFNGFQTSNSYRSMKALKEAKLENLKAAEREIKLAVKTLYFKAQLSVGNLKNTLDALKIAKAQSRDIELRYAAGVSSKLDVYSARKDVTNCELQIQQAQIDAAAVLEELLILTGQNGSYDVSGVPSTVQIRFDEPSVLRDKMLVLIELPAPNEEQPQVKASVLEGKGAEFAARAQEGLLWPRIDLMVRGQLLYPNVVQTTQVWNNFLQASIVIPLWLGDPNWELVKQKNREALAKRSQTQQKLRDLTRDYQKAVNSVKNLQKQDELIQTLLEQASEISDMTYKSYLAGRVPFLEVQMANQRLLEIRLEKTRIITSLLIQLSKLEYLS